MPENEQIAYKSLKTLHIKDVVNQIFDYLNCTSAVIRRNISTDDIEVIFHFEPDFNVLVVCRESDTFESIAKTVIQEKRKHGIE